MTSTDSSELSENDTLLIAFRLQLLSVSQLLFIPCVIVLFMHYSGKLIL